MSRKHFLLYWTFKTVAYHYYGGVLDHLSGNRLKRIRAGDTLWIASQRSGDLLLAGRLTVGEVTDSAESDAVFDEYHLWGARWHLAAASGTAEPMQLINLSELGVPLSLRFQSIADRLRVNRRGRLNVMSLYQPRQLTDDSAALLNYVWYNGQGIEQIETEPDPDLYIEGRATVRTQVIRQRSSALANAAKSRYHDAHGELRCEVCGMNFAEVYGELGTGYMEAHHPEPIAAMDGEQFTDVDGIVLLCANCHRMIHRKSPPYSVEAVRQAVQNQRERIHHKRKP